MVAETHVLQVWHRADNHLSLKITRCQRGYRTTSMRRINNEGYTELLFEMYGIIPMTPAHQILRNLRDSGIAAKANRNSIYVTDAVNSVDILNAIKKMFN